jgi:hypothetical protein
MTNASYSKFLRLYKYNICKYISLFHCFIEKSYKTGLTVEERKKYLIIYSIEGPSWPWSYDSWIYNYICNQCLSPLTLWVPTPLSLWCLTPQCQQYFSYFVAVRFIGEGNRSTRRKPPTCHKSLTNCITIYIEQFSWLTSQEIDSNLILL